LKREKPGRGKPIFAVLRVRARRAAGEAALAPVKGGLRVTKNPVIPVGAPPARLYRIVGEAEQERTRWDPKDGELCSGRTKPEETLVEVRSDSDVQIDRRT